MEGENVPFLPHRLFLQYIKLVRFWIQLNSEFKPRYTGNNWTPWKHSRLSQISKKSQAKSKINALSVKTISHNWGGYRWTGCLGSWGRVTCMRWGGAFDYMDRKKYFPAIVFATYIYIYMLCAKILKICNRSKVTEGTDGHTDRHTKRSHK